MACAAMVLLGHEDDDSEDDGGEITSADSDQLEVALDKSAWVAAGNLGASSARYLHEERQVLRPPAGLQ